jgi:hypothetical protein
MQSNQDLQHILKTAEIGERAKLTLLAEGIHTVADLLSATHRISNDSIHLTRGNRIELNYVVNWVRDFKVNHARMPDFITEFTKDSFEEFQNRPGEDVHFVNSQMLLDLYLSVSQKPDTDTEEMFNDINSMEDFLSEGSSIEAISNRLRRGKQTIEDQARIAQLLPGTTEDDINNYLS